MSFVNRIIGTVTFNKDTLNDVAESDDASVQAWIIIFGGAILSAILSAIAYDMTNDPQYLGLATLFGSNASDLVQVLLLMFAFQFLLVVFVGACLAFVGRGFGGSISTMGCVRLMGFASILSVVGSVVIFLGAVLDMPSLATLSSLLTLYQLVVLIYGYSVASKLNIVMSIIAVIIAFIIAVIILAIVIAVLFVAVIFAILGSA